MRILEPIDVEINENPIKVSPKPLEPGFAITRAEWLRQKQENGQIQDIEPSDIIKVNLFITSELSLCREYSRKEWESITAEIDTGAFYFGHGKAPKTDRDIFVYAYKNQFYYSEIHLELSEVTIILEKEKQEKRELLRREVDRITKGENAEEKSRLPITEEVQIFVWNRDGGRCVKCGSQEYLEFDHIIPFSKGGSNSARNIQLLCQRCNRSKLDRIGG